MRHKRTKVNILTNIILCLLSFILAIFGAEYILRSITIEGLSGHKMYMGKSDSEPVISPFRFLRGGGKHYEFNSGICYPSDTTGRLNHKIFTPDNDQYWHCALYDEKTRRHGFHPERKRQIALVGDSFVFGEGVNDVDTLGYALNEQYPGINFQNWGNRGANIDDVAETCKKIIKAVPQVEEVLYFYNLNDVRISDEISALPHNIIDFRHDLWLADLQRRGPVVTLFAKSALFSLSRKIWIIKKNSSLTIQNYRNMYLGKKNRQEFLATMDNVRAIQDILAERGISFHLIIYPLLYKDMLGRYPFEGIHAAIMNACREREILCLDGYTPFNNYYSMKRFIVHPLDYHPNGLSNRELVRYIHDRYFLTDKPK